MMELRHLRYFVAVAESLSFRAAAEFLHVSQPPLSRQIKQLEDTIGTALFERRGRRVKLTPAGTRFLKDAKAVLEGAASAVDMAQRVARGEAGMLRLGFVGTALYRILPDLVGSFRREFPGVKLMLSELTMNAQFAALERGDIDAGIVIEPRELNGIECRDLYVEPLVLCLPADHPLAARMKAKSVPLRKLSDDQFIIFPRRLAPGLYDRIMEVGERAGIALKIGQRAVQMQTIVGLVSAGLGVALVPECLTNLARPGIVYRKVTPAAAPVRTCLIWHPARRQGVVENLIALSTKLGRRRNRSSCR